MAASTPVARGAYLARAGNCAGCHTAPGGADYAGGRAIETPFGVVHGSNLTPDPTHGLGRWSAQDFWRAMHEGRSRDGRLLNPAFPYPSYTRITREDSDAIFAYLRTLPPQPNPNRPHALRFPFGTPWALAAWRALFFRPAQHIDEPGRPAAWNRGAYLVRGLGHCDGCHAERNAFGAVRDPERLAGGAVPMQPWYAPSLASMAQAGVSGWTVDETVRLLRTGRNAHAVVSGPMAEVVRHSTQHLEEADLRAIAVYLGTLPADPPPRPVVRAAPTATGAARYREHCADCHGEHGEGRADAAPALAGNRAVSMPDARNLITTMLVGGFGPSTRERPYPHGMPPFATRLDDQAVADIVNHLRGAWGNQGAPVRAQDVARLRR